jgi:hypothetical protein
MDGSSIEARIRPAVPFPAWPCPGVSADPVGRVGYQGVCRARTGEWVYEEEGVLTALLHRCIATTAPGPGVWKDGDKREVAAWSS